MWNQHQLAGENSNFGMDFMFKKLSISIKAGEAIRLLVCETDFQFIFSHSFFLIVSIYIYFCAVATELFPALH